MRAKSSNQTADCWPIQIRMGDARHDVNLRTALFIHPPEAVELGLFIRFDPDDINLQRSCHQPGSAYVTVTCMAATAGDCSRWEIDATPTEEFPERGMACVELSGGGGGPYAFYSLPFTATVTGIE